MILADCTICADNPDYIVCRNCGAHFLTVLDHDGLCFDCRDDGADA